jgi:hypothetical protein
MNEVSKIGLMTRSTEPAICSWDDPSKPPAERLRNLAKILANTVNAGEIENDDARMVVICASMIALQLRDVMLDAEPSHTVRTIPDTYTWWGLNTLR